MSKNTEDARNCSKDLVKLCFGSSHFSILMETWLKRISTMLTETRCLKEVFFCEESFPFCADCIVIKSDPNQMNATLIEK
ncbi:hypothetical protein CDAR_286091 [Caerostris darwini]|uniref:Uncharacterized protein n=1 Tax=Caerostris darwini TaxID=1538125 RepID=A0AAV4N536_9ARAC|nr:hypothetical protein CDAR_286091 [Caerostris darwini]